MLAQYPARCQGWVGLCRLRTQHISNEVQTLHAVFLKMLGLEFHLKVKVVPAGASVASSSVYPVVESQTQTS